LGNHSPTQRSEKAYSKTPELDSRILQKLTIVQGVEDEWEVVIQLARDRAEAVVTTSVE